MITAEDVKRWYQLLVGKSEQAMIDDIKKTLSHPTLPSDEVEFALKLNKYIHDQCIDGTPHDIGWNVMKMFSTRIAEMERELQEAKNLVRSITEFADGMKVLDGEALEILKKTARRVLSDAPTKLPRK